MAQRSCFVTLAVHIFPPGSCRWVSAMQDTQERARDARARADAATTDIERAKWPEIAEV